MLQGSGRCIQGADCKNGDRRGVLVCNESCQSMVEMATSEQFKVIKG